MIIAIGKPNGRSDGPEVRSPSIRREPFAPAANERYLFPFVRVVQRFGRMPHVTFQTELESVPSRTVEIVAALGPSALPSNDGDDDESFDDLELLDLPAISYPPGRRVTCIVVRRSTPGPLAPPEYIDFDDVMPD